MGSTVHVVRVWDQHISVPIDVNISVQSSQSQQTQCRDFESRFNKRRSTVKRLGYIMPNTRISTSKQQQAKSAENTPLPAKKTHGRPKSIVGAMKAARVVQAETWNVAGTTVTLLYGSTQVRTKPAGQTSHRY